MCLAFAVATTQHANGGHRQYFPREQGDISLWRADFGGADNFRHPVCRAWGCNDSSMSISAHLDATQIAP